MTANATLPGIIRNSANVIIVTISNTTIACSTRRRRNAANACPFRPGLTHDREGWSPRGYVTGGGVRSPSLRGDGCEPIGRRGGFTEALHVMLTPGERDGPMTSACVHRIRPTSSRFVAAGVKGK